jgi:DNA-binding MarR family transcriptional regulator
MVPAPDVVALRLLEEIGRDPQATQRHLSRRVGISLGMTNLLLRRMIRKAWVKAKRVRGRRMLYLLTPRGVAEKARQAREFVRLSLRYYVEFEREIAMRLDAGMRVGAWGAGDLAVLVREAVRRAGARYVGEARDGGVDAVIVLSDPPAERVAQWRRSGVRVVDLR